MLAKYPKKDLKKIFEDNGYHSPDIEMTDSESDSESENPTPPIAANASPDTQEESTSSTETPKMKLYTMQYWWRSEAVCIDPFFVSI